MVWRDSRRDAASDDQLPSSGGADARARRDPTHRRWPARQPELELLAMDLRIAVNAIGEIVGKTSTEDLLDSILASSASGNSFGWCSNETVSVLRYLLITISLPRPSPRHPNDLLT